MAMSIAASWGSARWGLPLHRGPSPAPHTSESLPRDRTWTHTERRGGTGDCHSAAMKQ